MKIIICVSCWISLICQTCSTTSLLWCPGASSATPPGPRPGRAWWWCATRVCGAAVSRYTCVQRVSWCEPRLCRRAARRARCTPRTSTGSRPPAARRARRPRYCCILYYTVRYCCLLTTFSFCEAQARVRQEANMRQTQLSFTLK